MGWQSSGVVRFDLGPLVQGQMRIAKLISAYNSLVMGPRGLRCETNLWEIMGWKSSDVVRFDLGPLLQGQTRIAKLKSAFNLLIIEKCCLSSKLCYLVFSGGYILHLTTDASLVWFTFGTAIT